MKFHTHILFSVVIGLAIMRFFPASGLFFSSLIFSTALPDIDDYHSFLGRRIKALSVPLKLIFGHREFFHSLLFAFIGAFLLSTIRLDIGFGFLIGVCSHLFLDGMTREGIFPLWPLRWRMNGFIRTGGIIEHIFFALLLVACIFLLFSRNL